MHVNGKEKKSELSPLAKDVYHPNGLFMWKLYNWSPIHHEKKLLFFLQFDWCEIDIWFIMYIFDWVVSIYTFLFTGVYPCKLQSCCFKYSVLFLCLFFSDYKYCKLKFSYNFFVYLIGSGYGNACFDNMIKIYNAMLLRNW